MRPALVFLACLVATPAAGETVEEYMARARRAWEAKDTDKALEYADKAIALYPKDARPVLFRGQLREELRHYPEAVADFDRCLELDPRLADAYQHRGTSQFKRGRIKESLADFDRFLELRPGEKPGHWQRGIALYYAGRFAEGKQQFKGYESVDTNDVENAVWHFLCAARVDGPEKARAGLLPIGRDRRVPMMVVYALFAGKANPPDVLEAAEAGDASEPQRLLRRFYAHLYLGLYHEAMGETGKSREHIRLAAEKYAVEGYMGDVARVHFELRERQRKGK